MTLPQIISRNISQKIPSFEINDRVVLQPHVWYVCPTGKKAIVKGRIACTGTGAAANADLLIAGQIMYRWLTAGAFIQSYIDAPRTLGAGVSQMALFEFELSAGDEMETVQNTGTNAEFNVWAEVIETDA